MKKKLIIEDSSFLTKVAYLNQGTVERIEIIKKDYHIKKNQIYQCRVKKNIVSSSGKLVDLGNQELGFLQVNKDLKNGDVVIAQIKKEPISSKLAKLTDDINLSGEYVIYLPYGKEIFLSNKIKNDTRSDKLVKKLSTDFLNIGLIVRTEAIEVDYEQVRDEVERLVDLFNEIMKKKKEGVIGLLYEQDSLSDFFHHFRFDTIDEIISNSQEIISKVKDWARSKKMRPEYIFQEIDLFGSCGISLTKLFSKKYEFGNISIIIEPTEAFTAVDVNSGYQERHCYMDDMALEVNLKSCKYVVDLIIKKNISGIILIDFIDMKKHGYQEKLLRRLREEFRRDIKKVSVLNITSLEIVQVIRQREKENIMDMISFSCPLCSGSGYLKSPLILLDELEVELRKYLYHRELKKGNILVLAPGYMKSYFDKNQSFLESKYGVSMNIKYEDYMNGVKLL